jgi:hypothetical protein
MERLPILIGGEGRLIPVLIIDCTEHRPLHDLIAIHEETPPGDVKATWSRSAFGKKTVHLTLDFERPVATSASFVFDIDRYCGLIDWIISARGVYLQPTTSGRRASEGIDKPKILVEVPPDADLPGWDRIYLKTVQRGYLQAGLSRAQAKATAAEQIAAFRAMSTRRLPYEYAQESELGGQGDSVD